VDDISVPICELPDPEADGGNSGETLRQLENKWTDLALTGLSESVSNANNNNA
jgi:anaphase-promoting complex subunit 13